MKSRISYVIHAQNVPDVGLLKAHLLRLNPAVVVVLDGLGLAREIKALLPGCMVIHRNYGITNGDDDVHKKVTPERWLELRAAEAEGGIWLYTTNEPGFDAASIEWHVQLMNLWLKRPVDPAKTYGGLVVGNFSVGTPEPDSWRQALAMLDILAAHPEQFVLGLHEYACAVITSGLYGGYPDNAGVQSGKSGGQNLIPSDKWPEDVSKITLWHMGRFHFLLNYCQKNGVKPPRIILTEHGMDDVSDIKEWAERLDKTPGYASIRGWKSLQRQWEVWFGAKSNRWSHEQAYFEQLKWADQTIYQGSVVEGQCLYCWGHSSPDWEQFDIATAPDLQKRLEAYAQQSGPMVEPPKAPALQSKPVNMTKKLTVRALNNMNVRYGPSLVDIKLNQNTTQAEVLAGNYIRLWGVPEIPQTQWTWVYCQIVTGNFALAEGWLFYPELQYSASSTKEIPVMKPPAVVQTHVLTVKVVAAAPYGDVLTKWVQGQIQGAGELFKSLNLDESVEFSVEEVQS